MNPRFILGLAATVVVVLIIQRCHRPSLSKDDVVIPDHAIEKAKEPAPQKTEPMVKGPGTQSEAVSPPTKQNDSIQAPTNASEAFPSKQEFAVLFQKKSMDEWLKDAKALGKDVDLPAYLNLGHEAGVIATATGEFEYRYDVSYLTSTSFGPESCLSFKLKHGPLIMGVVNESTLKFYQLSVPHAFIAVVRDKYFFVIYYDATESRNVDETNHPKNPLNTNTILFFARQKDGQPRYMGQLLKYIYPDPDLRLRGGTEFCENSWPEN